MSRVLCLLAAVALALGGASCGDEDEESEPPPGSEYAADVEAITDSVDERSIEAIDVLNNVPDDASAAEREANRLEEIGSAIERDKRDLETLAPPEVATNSADDLEFAIGGLALSLDTSASDLRAAGRFGEDVNGAANDASRLILAHSSGVSALSRAVRTLASEG